MKSILIGLTVSVVVLSQLPAKAITVEAVVAKDKDTKPTETFSADTPKLYCFFRTKGSETGDKLRAVWIAEDVGEVAPPNTRIDEATLTADDNNFYGAFSLSKPTKGWPIGKYHVDIYSGDEVAVSVKFRITAANKSAKSEDAEEDDGED